MRLVEVEAAGAEDVFKRHLSEIRLDHHRVRIERADDLAGGVEVFRRCRRDLVENDRVGKLDLIDKQINKCAVVLIAERLAAIAQEIARRIVLEQACRIDHRDHRIEPGDIRQAVAVFIAELEGGGDGQRFGNPGRFDQQVVETSLIGQSPHFLEKIVAQRAADAAIGHLDELLVGARQVGSPFTNEARVDVDLAHIVDDDRDPQAFTVVKNVIEQRRLAGTEEAGKDSHGKISGCHLQCPLFVTGQEGERQNTPSSALSFFPSIQKVPVGR
jgi:hypothetical protein